MRVVVALLDAPVPARVAVAEMMALGLEPSDMRLTPSVPGVDEIPELGPEVGVGVDRDARPAQCRAEAAPTAIGRAAAADVRRWLAARGVSESDAEGYAEGVRRGGILLAVETPDTTAPLAAEALVRIGVADLDRHRARWAADPALRYAWRSSAAPPLPPPVAPPDRAVEGATGEGASPSIGD
jgi:hypothetical protein